MTMVLPTQAAGRVCSGCRSTNIISIEDATSLVHTNRPCIHGYPGTDAVECIEHYRRYFCNDCYRVMVDGTPYLVEEMSRMCNANM